MTKEKVALDLWLKDVVPTSELRKWFGHDPTRWEEFEQRYWKELKANPDAVKLLRHKTNHGNVTFVYAARDEQHNGALALREFLERHEA